MKTEFIINIKNEYPQRFFFSKCPRTGSVPGPILKMFPFIINCFPTLSEPVTFTVLLNGPFTLCSSRSVPGLLLPEIHKLDGNTCPTDDPLAHDIAVKTLQNNL